MTSNASLMRRFLQRGGLWVIIQAVILAIVVVMAPLCGAYWHAPFLRILGLMLAVGASALGIKGTVDLGRNLTPFPKPGESTRLVQQGIYRYLRHPLYAAVFCGALGWAMLWQSWVALIAALALGPFFDAKARREERWLRQQFPEYAIYEQRVRRFIPLIY